MVITPFGWCFHNFIGKVTDSEKTKLECRQFQWQHIAFQKESLQGKGLCWVKNSNPILGNAKYYCLNTIPRKNF